MSGSYGSWQRPMFGRMHTRRSGVQVSPRQPWLSLLPREGAGDYRHPVVGRSGANQRRYSTDRSLWHNPVAFEMPGDSRADWAEPEYIPRQNGLPVFRPYVWRSPGWEERLARFGLDLAALRDVDSQLDQDQSDRLHQIARPEARRYKRRKAAA